MKGLDKIITQDSKVLILGTMPGIISIESNRYYCNPRNQFWQIMDKLMKGISTSDYKKKIKMLDEYGIALWDVLESCDREGSLDSKIEKGTEKPNDFQSLFDEFKSLRVIFFNGKSRKSSYKLFKKLVMKSLTLETKESLVLVPLPSSSSANTRQTINEKAEDWMVIQNYLAK